MEFNATRLTRDNGDDKTLITKRWHNEESRLCIESEFRIQDIVTEAHCE